MGSRTIKRRRALFEALEPRILYSADASILSQVDALAPSVDLRSYDAVAAITVPANTVAPQLDPVSSSAPTEPVSASSGAPVSLPLAFEQNVGQTDAQVDFLARGSGYGVFLADGDAVLDLEGTNGGHVVRLGLVDAHPDPQARGEEALSSRSNYLIGAQGSWHTDIANFGAVRYLGVYDGIDLRYYGTQRQLQYDFLVAAGADPDAIRLAFHGVLNTTLASDGDLVLILDDRGNEIRFSAPVTYQQGPAGREAVESRYVIHAEGTIGFEIGAYDTSRELVIDPVLVYGSYLGGTGVDRAQGIAVDAAGNAYLTGETASTAFPTTAGAYDTTKSTGRDVFVSKVNASGTGLVYSTFIGGSGEDVAWGIALDAAGNAHVAGSTTSSNLPTLNAFQSARSGTQDAFFLKLNAAGTALAYSTYYGGTGNGDIAYAVSVDAAGRAYVAGDTNSSSGIASGGAYDTALSGATDAFLAKFDPTLSGAASRVFGTYLGGTADDHGLAVAVDASGKAHVSGYTNSSNLPTTANAYDTGYNGGDDAYLTVFNATGSALTYSTYLGGGGNDSASAIALDAAGKVYLSGSAGSGFPTKSAYDSSFGGGAWDAIVAKLDPTLSGNASLIYSTYLGGAGTDSAPAIVVDSLGRAHVTGYTSGSFPTTADAVQGSSAGNNDAFYAMLGSNGISLVYSTYLGGSGDDTGYAIARDGSDSIYLAGYTASSNFQQTTGGAFDTTQNGSYDAFVVKFSSGALVVTTTNDVVDGATTSIAALLANKGADGLISLREAIIAANNTAGADMISLAAGTYILSRAGANENAASTGDLDITDDLTITGVGANTAFIDGAGADRVFEAHGSTVVLSGLTIQNGNASDGGGVRVGSGSTLTLRDAALTNNMAAATGGGSFVSGTLTLERVTVAGNSADVGGGIYVNNGASAALTNATMSGNTASSTGGAISTRASVTLINSTIASNAAGGAGGVNTQGSGSATLKNTILSGNAGGNASGVLTSLGNNIDSANTAGLTGPGDSINTDPLLGPLQYNGGTTKTHALLAGSFAINAGTATGAPATDQRGAARLGATDIGAYESTLIGYEPFAYPAGSFNGANGGTGWAAGWSSGGIDTTIASTGLQNASVAMPVSGGTAQLTIPLSFGNVTQTRDLATTIGAASTTTWLSFLVKPASTVPGDYAGLQFGSSSASRAFAGYNGSQFVLEQLGGSGRVTVSGITPVAGQTYLLTVKMDFAAGVDAMTLYVNPTPGLASPDAVFTATKNSLDLGTFAQIGINGGRALFSNNAAIDELRIGGSYLDVVPVRAVNAPVLDPARSPSLAAQNEDAGVPAGAVGTLVSSLVDFPGGGGLDNVTDSDSGALLGIAITAADTTNGSWWYSTNGGANWNALGAAADTNARLLAADASTRIYFQPNANYNGTIGSAITFRAWDQVSGSNGALASTSTNGGGTAFSVATDTASLTVTAVNDAPVNTVPGLQSTNEDTAKVFSAANGNQISILDVDAGGANNEVTLGVTNGTLTLAGIAGLSFTAGDGTADATMTFRGTAAAINTALNGLSYLPTANYNGGATLTLATKDSTLLSLDVDTGLLGRYAFENTGALGIDTSPAAGYPGTAGGATAVNDGTRGNVLGLAGAGYVRTTGRFGNPANVTLAAWVNLNAADISGAEVISLGDSVSLRVDQNGNSLAAAIYNGSTWITTTYATTLAGTGWHHVAYTFSDTGNSGTLYLDGVAVSTTSITNSISYTLGANSFIGTHGDGGASFDFNGRIDDARIYNRVLSAGEIATLAVDLSMTDADTVAIAVVAVNDAPTATNLSAAETYTEDTARNLTDIVVSDVDSASVTATLTLSNVAAGSLNTGTSGAVSSTFAGGTWTASGAIADVNALLAGVTFTPAADFNSNFTIVTSVSDGVAAPITGIKTMTGTAINDAPVLTGANNLNTINEDPASNSGTLVSALIAGRVTDADSGAASGIAVSAVNNANGTWQYTTNGGGLWTNFGTPTTSIARLLAANASTSVRFVPNANWNGTVAGGLTLRAWDQTSGTAGSTADTTSNGGSSAFSSATASAGITVTAVNDAPAGTNKTLTTNEDTAYTFVAADFGFSDVNDTPANSLNAVRISTLPGAGTLTNNGAAVSAGQTITVADINLGRLVFTPGAEGNGAGYASFTFQVQDDGGTANGGIDLDTSPNTMSVNVTAVNDAPSGTNNTVTTNEDSAYTFVAADFGFSDPNDAPANALNAVRISTLPVAGTLTNNGAAVSTGQTITVADINLGRLVFTPAANVSGIGYASFGFQVQDDGGTANGGIDLDASANTLTVNVTAVNDAPVLTGANNLNTINEDAASDTGTLVSALLAGWVTDADSGASSGIAVTAVTNTNGTWQYTTNSGGTWTAFGVPTSASARLLAADAGTSVRFVPNAHWNGTVAGGLTLRAWDQTSGTAGSTADTSSNGGSSAFSTAMASTSITVTAVNDAPSGTNNTVTTNEDSAYTFVAADFGFSDPNDAPANALNAVRISTLPGAGTLTNNGAAVSTGQTITVADINLGRLSFTPGANGNGAGYASFSFRVRDGGGTANGGVNLDPTANTMTVAVTAVNDAPVNTVPAAQSTAYNTPLVFSTANGNRIFVSDVDAAGASIEFGVSATNGLLTLSGVTGLTFTGGSNGSASMIFTGSLANVNAALDGLSFAPATNFSGAAAISLASNDQSNTGTGGARSDIDAVAIAVNPPSALNIGNDPYATPADTSLNAPSVLGNDFDPALGVMSVAAVNGNGAAVGGTIALPSGALLSMNADGTFTYDPNGMFDALAQGANSTESFTYAVSSTSGGTGFGTATITVNGVNDAPLLLGANDLNAIDEDPASDTGTLVSALIAGRVTDADSGAASGIAVSAVNNANGTWQYTTNGGGLWTNFGTPTTSIARLLAANASTSVRFVPNANWNGTVAGGLTLRAWDQTSGTAGSTADTTSNGGSSAFSSATASAGITVTAVNDAPAGTNKTLTTNEDTAYTFVAADFGFSDVNDTPANSLNAVRISTLPGAGTLTNNGAAVSAGQTITVADINLGRLVFTPGAEGNGAGYASFTFQVQDDGGTANGGIDLDTSPNTMSVNVTAVNDAPSGTNNTVTTNEDSAYTFVAADFGFSDPNDAPANALNAVRISTLPVAGTLTNNGAAVSTGQTITVADINLGRLVFTPAANVSGIGYASFGFQVQDDGGTANGGIDLDASANTLTVNVTAVNDAPVLTGANNLNTINEDAASDTGTLVSALLAGWVTDADSGASSGIAVTAVTNTNGTWQYTTNSGGTWTAFGVPTSASARLLAADAGTSVRFVPNAHWNGTVAGGLTLRAWDQTSGTAGSTADTSSNGGSSAFSTAMASTSITVTAVNDAPSGTNNTVTTNEDSAYTFVAADFGFSDPNDAPANALNAVRISTLPGAGTLTNNGAAVSTGQTITVADINLGRLSFTPGANGNGAGYASFSFQVQDDGGTVNSGIDLDPNPDVFTVNVSAVNDAPVLSGANPFPDLQPNTLNSQGALVADLIAGFVNDVDPGASRGIVITAADGTNGTWQYSTDDGSTWTALGSPREDAALALGADAGVRLRFVPGTDFTGVATVTFRAWDRTAGASGAIVDATINGGATAFSIATAAAAVNVQPVIVVSVASPETVVLLLDMPKVPEFGALPAIGTGGAGSNTPAGPASGQQAGSAVANTTPPAPRPIPVAVQRPVGTAFAPAAEPTGASAAAPPATAWSPPVETGGAPAPMVLAEPVTGALQPFTLSESVRAMLGSGFVPSPYQTADAVEGAALRDELDRMREATQGQSVAEHRIAGAIAGFAGGLSAGYVLWLVRGGVLLSSLLSSLPAWRVLDPLPVLGRRNRRDGKDADEESLESLVEGSGNPGRQPNDAERGDPRLNDAAPEVQATA